MDKLRLTSPGLLLILAVAAAGAIFLVDRQYLRPQALQQEQFALNDQVRAAEKSAGTILTAESDGLLRLCSSLAQSGRSSLPAPDVLDDLRIDLAWQCDSDGKIAQVWSRNGGTLSDKERAMLDQLVQWAKGRESDDLAGPAMLWQGPAIVARQEIPSDAPAASTLWLARWGDGSVLRRIGEALNGEVVFIPEAKLPCMDSGVRSASHTYWQDEDSLNLALLVHDVNGRPLGYFSARLPASQAHRQAAAGRRTVLIVLSLSMGLSLLVIMGAHMLITGPVVRLLGRLKRLELGQGSPKDLSRDLHGEPLLLARQLESAFDRLAHVSKTDQLTGLANRRHFEQVLSAFYNQARRYSRPLSLVVLDVDFFKAVNDTGGHPLGDQVLKAIAKAVEGACRKADLPARFGGDEFAVLMPETDAQAAHECAQRISRAVAGLNIRIKSLGVKVTVSVGVADLNSGEISSPEAMLALADRALYAAKETGRHRIVLAHDLTGLNWHDSPETGARVDTMCKKLAGLDTQFKDLFLRAVEEMVVILEHRCPQMAGHAVRTQHFAALIGREMGLSPRVLKRIEIAAMLQDIGMIAMPDSVLLSAGSLDEQQLNVMRRHPLLSVRIMEGMEFLEQEIPAVRYHHERFDGKGYPEGISGAAIPLTARILAVADAFDAMTSARTFRGAMTRKAALEELRKSAGTQFDPVVVEVFLSLANRLDDGLMDVPGRNHPADAQRVVVGMA